jgi:hypothetical protein
MAYRPAPPYPPARPPPALGRNAAQMPPPPDEMGRIWVNGRVVKPTGSMTYTVQKGVDVFPVQWIARAWRALFGG